MQMPERWISVSFVRSLARPFFKPRDLSLILYSARDMYITLIRMRTRARETRLESGSNGYRWCGLIIGLCAYLLPCSSDYFGVCVVASVNGDLNDANYSFMMYRDKCY